MTKKIKALAKDILRELNKDYEEQVGWLEKSEELPDLLLEIFGSSDTDLLNQSFTCTIYDCVCGAQNRVRIAREDLLFYLERRIRFGGHIRDFVDQHVCECGLEGGRQLYVQDPEDSKGILKVRARDGKVKGRILATLRIIRDEVLECKRTCECGAKNTFLLVNRKR